MLGPNCFPENDSDALEIIEKFNDSKSGFKKLTEIKLATAVVHNDPMGLSTMFQLLDQPQTIFLTRFSTRDASISCKRLSLLQGIRDVMLILCLHQPMLYHMIESV